ncbi:MAG: DUF4143 domain-containing protein, partial [Acidimicrobiales bacterium]
MGAVRRAVDEDVRPGRFLLTGSARPRRGNSAWSGIGRVVQLKMFGLTQAEIVGRSDGLGLIDRLQTADLDLFPAPANPPDLRGYIELALRGGFPEPALHLVGSARHLWLDSYVDQVVTRDAESLDGVRDPVLLRRYFETLCVNTAGLVDERAVLRNCDLLGRLIDTFVVSQIRPGAELSHLRPRLDHLRDKEGRHETDLLVEMAGGDVVAIEINASASPDSGDARHVAWLRDQLGRRFIAGAVLHTGPRPFSLLSPRESSLFRSAHSGTEHHSKSQILVTRRSPRPIASSCRSGYAAVRRFHW